MYSIRTDHFDVHYENNLLNEIKLKKYELYEIKSIFQRYNLHKMYVIKFKRKNKDCTYLLSRINPM